MSTTCTEPSTRLVTWPGVTPWPSTPLTTLPPRSTVTTLSWCTRAACTVRTWLLATPATPAQSTLGWLKSLTTTTPTQATALPLATSLKLSGRPPPFSDVLTSLVTMPGDSTPFVSTRLLVTSSATLPRTFSPRPRLSQQNKKQNKVTVRLESMFAFMTF